MVICPLRCQEITQENTQPVSGTVECPICFDLVTNGRLLPCGHMYCSVCIDKMFYFQHQQEQRQRQERRLQRQQSYVRDGYDGQSNPYRTRNERALQQQEQHLLQQRQQQQRQQQRQEIQHRLLQHQEQEPEQEQQEQ